MNTATTRNDVKLIAKTIETLAQEIQAKLDNGGEFLATANELTRNNLTLVFTLGEVYAMEQAGTGKKVTAKRVSAPRSASANYHNVRDNRGRFVRKV